MIDSSDFSENDDKKAEEQTLWQSPSTWYSLDSVLHKDADKEY